MAESELTIPAFSAHICLYANSDATEVDAALTSAFKVQTYCPAELVVVFDGPVSEAVEEVIDSFAKILPCRIIRLLDNMGHGYARAAAIANTRYAWSAVIDADDISQPDRFEHLCKIAKTQPELAVIGSALTEFYEADGEFRAVRERFYPETTDEIIDFARSRSPIAQPTALLNVSAIRAVGNYKSWHNNEDYYLWLRLLKAGYKMYNVQKSLLLFRTNLALYGRRGGLVYWWNEVRLQWFSLRQSTTTPSRFFFGIAVRFVIQVMMPPRVRRLIYCKLLGN